MRFENGISTRPFIECSDAGQGGGKSWEFLTFCREFRQHPGATCESPAGEVVNAGLSRAIRGAAMREEEVIVRKIGPLTALIGGICSLIGVGIICATGLAVYGLYSVNRHLDELVDASPDIVTALTEWQQALPPALADAIDDRRAPEYRRELDVSVRLVPGDRGRGVRPLVEVINEGNRIVTVLSLRVVIENEDGLPIEEHTTYAATPLAVDDEWRGPLSPGSKRRFALRTIWDEDDDLTATIEVGEVRVWNETSRGHATPAGSAETSEEMPEAREGFLIPDEALGEQDQEPDKESVPEGEQDEVRGDEGEQGQATEQQDEQSQPEERPQAPEDDGQHNEPGGEPSQEQPEE